MINITKKYFIIIVISILLIIVAALLILNTNKKAIPSQETKQNISNSEPIKKIKQQKNEIPIQVVIEPEDDNEIYGYDENAMQVKDSYNGFPACAYIEIPKTGVSLPVLSNQTVSGMEFSCCKLYSTGDINESGNTYIVAHNYENRTLFSDNKNLEIGDKIILTGLYKNKLEYTIYNIFNTTPTDTSYLTKPIDENNIEITLQTCNNDDDDTRLIIEAVHEKVR